ncbi:MAG: hypothetical protein LUH05_00350 [Candidatus Gastranaerophilales bacterium]|nr:hypothetical protein [Candidatus Gastranaerophilales bacterium]
MKVSAVGFLFQDKLKGNGLKGKNYTCVIHKANSEGNFNRNIISSPIVKQSSLEVVSPDTAKLDILSSLDSITDKNKNSKFIGATIKDGIKETEIHSLFSDKLFAVRTKDEFGKNHFNILGKNKTQKVLSNNLYINA